MSTQKNYSQAVRFSFQSCTAPASMPASFSGLNRSTKMREAVQQNYARRASAAGSSNIVAQAILVL